MCLAWKKRWISWCMNRGMYLLALCFFMMSSSSLSADPIVSLVKAVNDRSVFMVPDGSTIPTTVTFSSIISNSNAASSTDAQNVVFLDPLPQGATFIPGTVTVQENGGPIVSVPLANPTVGIPLTPYLTGGVLSPGSQVEVTFQAEVDYPLMPNPRVDPWRISNTSSTSYSYPGDPINVIESNEVAVVLPPQAPSRAAVQVAKSAQPNSNLEVGDLVTFTSVITPNQNDAFDAIMFQDLLDPGLMYDPSQGVTLSQPGTTTVTLMNVDPTSGFTVFSTIDMPPVRPEFAEAFSKMRPITVTFVAMVTSPSPFTGDTIYNTSTVSYIRHNEQQENVASNEVTLTLQPIPPEQPFLSVAKRVTTAMVVNGTMANVQPGDTATFNIEIANAGDTAANDVEFSDTLAAGLTYVPNSFLVNGVAQAPTIMGQVISYTIPTVPAANQPGNPVTVSFQVTVDSPPPEGVTSYMNVAEATYIVSGEDSVTATSNPVMLLLQESSPNLTVVKDVTYPGQQTSANVGDVLTFTTTVSNTGDGVATGPFFIDPLPPELQFVSNSVTVTGVPLGTTFSYNPELGFLLPDISPGESVTVTFRALLVDFPPSGTINNIAKVSYCADIGEGCVLNVREGSVIVTVNEPATATVQLVKSVSPMTPVSLHDRVTFTTVITNTSPLGSGANLINPWFVDPLPSGLSFVPGTLTVGGFGVPGNPTQGIQLNTLAPGASVTVVFDAEVVDFPTSGLTFTNVSELFYCLENENGVCVPTRAQSQTNPAVVVTVNNPSAPVLTVEKWVNGQESVTVEVGDVVNFQTMIRNNGPGSVFNPLFIDQLPPGIALATPLNLVASVPYVGNDPTQGITLLTTLAPNETVTVSFNAVIVAQPRLGTAFENVSSVLFCFETAEGCVVQTFPSNPVTVNVISVPLPVPVGILSSCRLIHHTMYTLKITWNSPFTNIQVYRIYLEGNLVAEVSGGQPLFYQARLKNRCDAVKYSVQAVYVGGSTTAIIPVRVDQ